MYWNTRASITARLATDLPWPPQQRSKHDRVPSPYQRHLPLSGHWRVSLLLVLIASAGLLAIVNAATKRLQIFGIILEAQDTSEKYVRRSDLAKKLIRQTKTDDWATRLGMIRAEDRFDLEIPFEDEAVTKSATIYFGTRLIAFAFYL